jgi:hypothetical protein
LKSFEFLFFHDHIIAIIIIAHQTSVLCIHLTSWTTLTESWRNSTVRDFPSRHRVCNALHQLRSVHVQRYVHNTHDFFLGSRICNINKLNVCKLRTTNMLYTHWSDSVLQKSTDSPRYMPSTQYAAQRTRNGDNAQNAKNCSAALGRK